MNSLKQSAFKLSIGFILLCLFLTSVSWSNDKPKTETQNSSAPVVLFLDTDIGSDVDDSLALLTILGSKAYRLVGISTVNGDTKSRAQIAQRVLELAHRTDIPVAPGVGSTLLRRKQPRDWHVQLEQHLDVLPQQPLSQQHGVDLMIRKIHENPGLTIAAVGPLTNVALAIIKDPSIVPEIGQLVVVGGAIGLPPVQERGSIFVDYKSEYNFNSDPDATQVVFESQVPILMSGLNPALQVTVSREQVAQWEHIKTPVAQWITARVMERLNRHKSPSTHLGDVMGAIMAAHPNAGKTHVLPLHLEMWGNTLRTVIDPTGTGRPVTVVLSAQQAVFKTYFLDAMNTSLKN